ncbi:MAG: response regulator [Herpetosiphonaceae bacterium]|nr:response regulator [Herpetosiphonaceae bacterium]
MIGGDERWQQLGAAFAGELEDRMPVLTGMLLDLERDTDKQTQRETVEALFREVHSLKGAARVVKSLEVEQLAHTFEGSLTSWREPHFQPDAAWFDTAFGTISAFGQIHPSDSSQGVPPPFPTMLSQLTDVPAREAAAVPAVVQVLEQRLAETPVVSQAGSPSLTPITLAPPGVAERMGSGGVRAPTDSIRVAVVKLDQLLAQAGELTVTHIRIEQRADALRFLRDDLLNWRREWRGQRRLRGSLQHAVSQERKHDAFSVGDIEALLRFTERSEQRVLDVLQQVEVIVQQFRQDVVQLGAVTHRIEDEVMAVRLLPVSTIFDPFQRLIRDLQRDLEKEVVLVLDGGEIEIDRKILEQLRDPVMHMLRNSVDHGIESPEERLTAGKQACGTIHLTVAQVGGVITLELADDGSGLDAGRLRQAAITKGLLSLDEAAGLDDQHAYELIFQPGFSTSPTITGTSGRGVGMDVVRENVERLHGHLTMKSELGSGTCFTITVPQTLATTRAIVIEQSNQLFALPSVMTERNARVRARDIRSVEGRQAVVIEECAVPLVELADVLERPHSASYGAWRTFFILRKGDQRVAFLTDQLAGEQEIVVKHLPWPLRRVRNVSGATVLGSGQTVIILNPVELFKTGLELIGRSGKLDPKPVVVAEQRRCVLVVDDSLTTRALERSILEAAGYETAVASDGREALDILHRQPIDLVVSDVEMPGIDGFALTAAIRCDERLRLIPVVLMTSLEAREHQERGVRAGADAYLVKSTFDQGQLLQTIGRLL